MRSETSVVIWSLCFAINVRIWGASINLVTLMSPPPTYGSAVTAATILCGKPCTLVMVDIRTPGGAWALPALRPSAGPPAC